MAPLDACLGSKSLFRSLCFRSMGFLFVHVFSLCIHYVQSRRPRTSVIATLVQSSQPPFFTSFVISALLFFFLCPPNSPILDCCPPLHNVLPNPLLPSCARLFDPEEPSDAGFFRYSEFFTSLACGAVLVFRLPLNDQEDFGFSRQNLFGLVFSFSLQSSFSVRRRFFLVTPAARGVSVPPIQPVFQVFQCVRQCFLLSYTTDVFLSVLPPFSEMHPNSPYPRLTPIGRDRLDSLFAPPTTTPTIPPPFSSSPTQFLPPSYPENSHS